MPQALFTKTGSSLLPRTTRRPVFTTATLLETSVGTTEIFVGAGTEVPAQQSVSFDPEEWINQFEHNQTHVKIAFGNNSVELLWQNDQVNFIISNNIHHVLNNYSYFY